MTVLTSEPLAAPPVAPIPTPRRGRAADSGPDVLPEMEHFIALVRKAKRPALVLTLVERVAQTEVPASRPPAAGAKGMLPPSQRNVLFQDVAALPFADRQRLEVAAAEIHGLDDGYGSQAVRSLLGAGEEDLLTGAVDRQSRALYLYLRQEYPPAGEASDRRFARAEIVQAMNRGWKSENYASHYKGPQGIVPTIDDDTLAVLRQRIADLYPQVPADEICIEHYLRRDLTHTERSTDGETGDTAPVALHTLTATFNGTTAHFKQLRDGDVIECEEPALLSVCFSWDPGSGGLAVFSEDREHRRELAMLFRDVLLAGDGALQDLAIREFHLHGFLSPVMLDRLQSRVDGIDRIAIQALAVARIEEQCQVDAAGGPDRRRRLVSPLTIGRDRYDTREVYQVACEAHGLYDLSGYVMQKVKLVLYMAKQWHRRAHRVTVEITAPNGLSDGSKTADDRRRVLAQLAHLGVLSEF